MSRFLQAALAGAAVALLAAAPAAEAYRLGPDVTDPVDGITGGFVATTLGGSNVAPTNGTITQWSARLGTAGASVRLMVLRPVGATWVPVGTSPWEVQAAGLYPVNTFDVPAGLAIHAGDILAVNLLGGYIGYRLGTGTIAYALSAPSIGSPFAVGAPHPDEFLMLNAQVTPLDTTHLEVVPSAGSSSAGDTVSVTVRALKADDTVDTNFDRTVHFTSNDAQAGLPADYTFTAGDAGQKTFTVTLSPGSRTITATDTLDALIAATSSAVTVSPGPVSALSITGAPTTASAGDPVGFTVSARDAYGNLVTGYGGTVHFSSTDGRALLPADATLTGGSGSFTATLRTSGSQTVSVGDGTRSGTTAGVAVAPGPAAELRVTAPSTATTAAPFDVTVEALDVFGNRATGSTATVSLASSDPGATLPATTSLVAGTSTLPGVALANSGSWTITASSAGLASGSQTVMASGPASALELSVPAAATAGTPFDVTVTARDASGNVATGYSGTVGIASSDDAAVLPPAATLTAGAGTFSVQLRTAGPATLTASDGTRSDESATIAVASAPVARFVVDGPTGPALFGIPFTFTVTALDAYDNRVTGYGGTIRFSSTAGHAALPGTSALPGGRGTFGATMLDFGPQRITALDTALPAVIGTSEEIPVYVPFFAPVGPAQLLPPVAEAESRAPSGPGTTPARPFACRRVPSLTGYTYAGARRVLQRDGCVRVKVRRRGPLRRGGRATIVKSQTPKPGTQPRVGDVVTLRLGVRR